MSEPTAGENISDLDAAIGRYSLWRVGDDYANEYWETEEQFHADLALLMAECDLPFRKRETEQEWQDSITTELDLRFYKQGEQQR